MIRIEPLAVWDGYTPEWIEGGGAVWLSRGDAIYRAGRLGAAPRRIARAPIEAWRRLATRFDLFKRAFRLAFYSVVPRGDGSLFIAFDRSLLVYQDGEWRRVEGLARPFRILRGCCALANDGSIYFGEYFNNADRGAHVHVYRLPPASHRAEIVHSFAPGEIRHVHGIYLDPVTDHLWICAGDLPSECRVLRSRDRFRSLETVGNGDESWRAVKVLFTDTAIYYATDSEFAPNYIYRIRRDDFVRERVAEIDGPFYYSTDVGGGLAFATTAELCPSQKRPEAVIWSIEEDGAVRDLARYRKDLFALRQLVPYFQAGIVQFPSGRSRAAAAPFSGSGLVGLNSRMFMLMTG